MEEPGGPVSHFLPNGSKEDERPGKLMNDICIDQFRYTLLVIGPVSEAEKELGEPEVGFEDVAVLEQPVVNFPLQSGVPQWPLNEGYTILQPNDQYNVPQWDTSYLASQYQAMNPQLNDIPTFYGHNHDHGHSTANEGSGHWADPLFAAVVGGDVSTEAVIIPGTSVPHEAVETAKDERHTQSDSEPATNPQSKQSFGLDGAEDEEEEKAPSKDDRGKKNRDQTEKDKEKTYSDQKRNLPNNPPPQKDSQAKEPK